MDICERVIKVLSEVLNIDPVEIHYDDDFETDLGIDSLDVVEVIDGLEQEFGIRIEDSDIKEIHVVNDLIENIKRKLER